MPTLPESQITTINIDEQYPIARRNNPSQGFRDNFRYINDNLDIAHNEITELMRRPLGVQSDWVEADFTKLSQKNAASIGVIVQDGETTSALIDRICQSVGAWWGFDSSGKFRVARLDAPYGTASATLTENQIIEIERQPEANQH